MHNTPPAVVDHGTTTMFDAPLLPGDIPMIVGYTTRGTNRQDVLTTVMPEVKYRANGMYVTVAVQNPDTHHPEEMTFNIPPVLPQELPPAEVRCGGGPVAWTHIARLNCEAIEE